MLVVIGDERAVDALIAFVETPVAVPALWSVYENARGRAIVGLGDLIRRTGSERALTYLIEGLTPQTWTKRDVRGVAQWTKSFEEYDSLLAEYAIYGLAHYGHPRAGEALRALQRSPTPEQARFRKGLDNTLEQWLKSSISWPSADWTGVGPSMWRNSGAPPSCGRQTASARTDPMRDRRGRPTAQGARARFGPRRRRAARPSQSAPCS